MSRVACYHTLTHPTSCQSAGWIQATAPSWNQERRERDSKYEWLVDILGTYFRCVDCKCATQILPFTSSDLTCAGFAFAQPVSSIPIPISFCPFSLGASNVRAKSSSLNARPKAEREFSSSFGLIHIIKLMPDQKMNGSSSKHAI